MVSMLEKTWRKTKMKSYIQKIKNKRGKVSKCIHQRTLCIEMWRERGSCVHRMLRGDGFFMVQSKDLSLRQRVILLLPSAFARVSFYWLFSNAYFGFFFLWVPVHLRFSPSSFLAGPCYVCLTPPNFFLQNDCVYQPRSRRKTIKRNLPSHSFFFWPSRKNQHTWPTWNSNCFLKKKSFPFYFCIFQIY